MSISIVFIFTIAFIGICVLLCTTPKSDTQRISVVKAGDVTEVTQLTQEIRSINDKIFKFCGERISLSDYKMFIVAGKSMSSADLHTGDIVLANLSIQPQQDDIIVLQINETNEFKLCKFKSYLKTDSDVPTELKEKYKENKEKFPTEEIFILSETGGKNGNTPHMSIHPRSLWIGTVEYKIPKGTIDL